MPRLLKCTQCAKAQRVQYNTFDGKRCEEKKCGGNSTASESTTVDRQNHEKLQWQNVYLAKVESKQQQQKTRKVKKIGTWPIHYNV